MLKSAYGVRTMHDAPGNSSLPSSKPMAMVRYQQIVTSANNSKELVFGEDHSEELKQRQTAKHKENNK